MSVPFYNLLFNIEMEPSSQEPTYLQLARKISEIMTAGKLQAGTPMPGTRTLAKALRISRNAAIAAYGELHDQGWIETEVGFGTRVAPRLPESTTRSTGAIRVDPGLCGFDLPGEAEPPGIAHGRFSPMELWAPAADPRLMPADEITRAFRRGLAKAPRPVAAPLGPTTFLDALAELLAQRKALGTGPSGLVATGGSLPGLDLVARTFLRPGDRVAVEEPGNPRAWAVLRRAGAELVPVPVDGEGLQTEALEDICIAHRPRLLYLTPNCQWPTTAILSAERRSAVLELAARYRMIVLEDDHAAELYHEERSWSPLASQDRRGVVIHAGTFEHLMSPTFALGWLAGPLKAMAALRRAQGAAGIPAPFLFSEIIRELILDGAFLRHVRKARTTYRGRRDRVLAALETGPLGPGGWGLRAHAPASGLGLWLEAEAACLEAFRAQALEAGLGLRPDAHWRLGPSGPSDASGTYLAFGPLKGAEWEALAARLAPSLLRS